MLDTVIQRVWSRARATCEYCRVPQAVDELPFQIDHIVARKHGGDDREENLALACTACNNHKGPNIAGLDRISGVLTPLFHPRRDRWSDHFAWHGPELVGQTAIGRTTIDVLAMNLPYRVSLREALLAEGVALNPPV
jgi:hypothetical protein